MRKQYILVVNNGIQRLISVDAQSNPLDDSTFICKYEDRKEKWRVVDKSTGLAIVHGKTKKEAIQRFIGESSRYLNYKESNPYYQKQLTRFKELLKEVENGEC